MPEGGSDYCLDPCDGHMFAEDLSPPAIDNCQLLPAFKDVSRNDLRPTDTKPRLRKKKTTKVEAIRTVQNILLDADLTPTLLLLHLLGPETSNPLARTAFFRRTNEANICELLSTILEDDKGSRIFKKWMVPHAVNIVCDLVNVVVTRLEQFFLDQVQNMWRKSCREEMPGYGRPKRCFELVNFSPGRPKRG